MIKNVIDLYRRTNRMQYMFSINNSICPKLLLRLYFLECKVRLSNEQTLLVEHLLNYIKHLIYKLLEENLFKNV